MIPKYQLLAFFKTFHSYSPYTSLVRWFYDISIYIRPKRILEKSTQCSIIIVFLHPAEALLDIPPRLSAVGETGILKEDTVKGTESPVETERLRPKGKSPWLLSLALYHPSGSITTIIILNIWNWQKYPEKNLKTQLILKVRHQVIMVNTEQKTTEEKRLMVNFKRKLSPQ